MTNVGNKRHFTVMTWRCRCYANVYWIISLQPIRVLLHVACGMFRESSVLMSWGESIAWHSQVTETHTRTSPIASFKENTNFTQSLEYTTHFCHDTRFTNFQGAHKQGPKMAMGMDDASGSLPRNPLSSAPPLQKGSKRLNVWKLEIGICCDLHFRKCYACSWEHSIMLPYSVALNDQGY